MKHTVLLLSLSIIAFLYSCNQQQAESIESEVISSFGGQPSVTTGFNNEAFIVFGDQESIYLSKSADEGASFSEPSIIATLNGLALGYSSGPNIVTTPNHMIITAPDTLGNLYSWNKPNGKESWAGPFRINDIDGSAGEWLSDIAATPDGRLFTTWIDTRFLEKGSHDNHRKVADSHKASSSKQEAEEDLSRMTPLGITKGELYEKIGGVPENAKIKFHNDNGGKLYWVLLDQDGKVLKAENIEEYKNFRKRNGERVRTEGKIYVASSDDGGQTWSKSNLIYKSPDGSVCECCKPSIISDRDGNLIVMFRNNINGSRDLHFTKSLDNGETFSQPEKLGTGTWKINGCPMDGGGLIVDKSGELKTIWQREGEVFVSSSSVTEQKMGSGRSPSIATNDKQSYIVFSNGEDIMSLNPESSVPTKIGNGTSPKVLALSSGAIYFWVNSEGINYKKI